MSAGLCDQIASMRRKLQKIATARILFLDETALRLSAAPTHTIVLPGEQPYVLATDTSSYAARYDMIAVCSGVETLLPKVYTPAERKGAAVRGVNSAMLQQFIDDTLAQAVEGLDRYPLTLVLDQASIHKNVDAIRQAFHDRGSQAIKDILLMPPNAAKRMSPLETRYSTIGRSSAASSVQSRKRPFSGSWLTHGTSCPPDSCTHTTRSAASCAARIHTLTAPIPPDISTATEASSGSCKTPSLSHCCSTACATHRIHLPS